MINLLKSRERERNVSNVSNNSYVGILVIYLVSAAVAATVILPEEEYWYFGVIKREFWIFLTIYQCFTLSKCKHTKGLL